MKTNFLLPVNRRARDSKIEITLMKSFNHFGLLLTLVGALAVPMSLWAAGGAAGEKPPYATSVDKHFHPKGKATSKYTMAVIKSARE
jgi:hypothetical protein